MTPQALAQDAGTLFSLPEAAVRVNELIRDPDHNAGDLARVVELDAGLTARLLRLANSPLFGHVGKIDRVSHAVVLIGERALRDLVLATSVTNVFKGIPEEFVDMASFWDNSATCGVVARLLAPRCGIRDSEPLFLAGMLHGIGHLVFYSRQPERYREVLKSRGEGDAAILAAETRVFGFTYADLGAALLAQWKFPEFYQVVVAHQFTPQDAGKWQKEAAILNVARDMAASLAPSLKNRQPLQAWAAGYDDMAGQLLGLSPDELESVRVDSLAQAFDIIDIINPGASTIF
jgi:HD-like signal output (HDOD) protein